MRFLLLLSSGYRHFMIEVQLNRGSLLLRPEVELWPCDELLGFAERINPRRAFLFVSKVLGRHIPARPARIRQAFTALADQIPSNLPEPVLVIGMAETAVGLGAGVHDALKSRYPNALFMATTRHPLDADTYGAPLFAEFQEEHSHAPSHLLYGSPDPVLQAQLLATRTLILVDDEASTGKTFLNLTAALRQTGLHALEHLVMATLADWSTDVNVPDLNCHSVSLLKGSWQWQAKPDAPEPVMPKVDVVAQGRWPISQQQTWGRMPTLSPVGQLALAAKPGERILLLGSSEFVWAPFLLAEQLEAQGAAVHFSSTTRSPIAVGHAIQHALAFSDNYGLGIANFAYNVIEHEYDRIILAVETAAASVDPALLAALPHLEIVTNEC